MALTDVQTRRAGLSASAELLVISSTDTVHERRPQKLWNRQSSSASFIFFFQAEDGIRDRDVTGVQTCALPIFDKLYLPAMRALTVPASSAAVDREFSVRVG